MNLLAAKKISKSYGSEAILENVDLEILAGEVVGIIGPNGVGKSTLMQILAGSLSPDNGSVEILGRELHSWNPAELAQKRAYLPQNQEVHWPLSVRRIVELGRFPHSTRVSGAQKECQAPVEEAMREAGVVHLADRRADQLSGGERTLVLLARALASDPELLLMDEPVQALDPGRELQVLEMLRRQTDRGRGILLVMHHLTLAARFCDRLYLLHGGRILSSGKTREVLSPMNLKTAYDLEAEIAEKDGELHVIPWKRIGH